MEILSHHLPLCVMCYVDYVVDYALISTFVSDVGGSPRLTLHAIASYCDCYTNALYCKGLDQPFTLLSCVVGCASHRRRFSSCCYAAAYHQECSACWLTMLHLFA